MGFYEGLNTMVMFMESQGNNIVQMLPISEAKDTNSQIDFIISELPPKTVLDYNCKGLQL